MTNKKARKPIPPDISARVLFQQIEHAVYADIVGNLFRFIISMAIPAIIL